MSTFELKDLWSIRPVQVSRLKGVSFRDRRRKLNTKAALVNHFKVAPVSVTKIDLPV